MNFIDPNMLIYSYYVKYDKLLELINTEYRNSGATSIDIFVDAYSIIKSFGQGTISNDTKLSLAAGIINLCAHYRGFLMSRYSTTSRFFIIWSNYSCKYNTYFIQNYSKENRNNINHPEVMNNVIYNNMEILNKLVPFIPDIHYIDTIFEFGVRVKEIIDKDHEYVNTPKLIITKDLYNLQLLSLPQDVRILRPMKYKGEDISYIINKNNFMHTLFNSRKCNYIENNISPGLISTIFALNRLPERSIRNIYSLDVVVRMLSLMIQDRVIINDYNSDIHYILDKVNEYHKSKKRLNKEEIVLRFKAIDLLFQYGIYNSNKEKNMYMGIVNLYNPEEVKSLNSTLFKDTPLDLMNL